MEVLGILGGSKKVQTQLFSAILGVGGHFGVIPCETTEKKLDVTKIVSNFLGLLVTPNEE